jgi:anti-anti-sigma factor
MQKTKEEPKRSASSQHWPAEDKAWIYELSIKDAGQAQADERLDANANRPAQLNEHTVLINLSNISQIDSWGLAFFFEAMQHIRANGGKLALFGVRDSVRQIFETARLDQVFTIFPTREEALADPARLAEDTSRTKAA